jgi:uncharacterized protein (DUF1501 family)
MKHECQHDHSGPECRTDAERPSGPSRRELLGGSALATAALITAPAWLPRTSFGRGTLATRDVLVHVYLRGGADGLTIVPPYGDAQYFVRRPALAIPAPGQPNGAVLLPGNGFFGLAPAAAPLLTPYNAGKLLIAHATGSVDPSRSHFDAQRYMELGTTSSFATTISDGWIGRHLQTSTPIGNGLLRGLALQDGLPRVLNGGPATLPVKDPNGFVLPGSASTATARRARLTAMYASEAPPLGPAAASTFGTIDLLDTIDFTGYVPANGAAYPNTTFGTQLKSTATMIKAQIGLEVISIDYNNWDLHNQLGPLIGAMATKMDDLARGLEAFYKDLSTGWIDSVTVVVMSEFGRRVSENASGGCDHGHGNALFVMGGHVNGGQVLANWPGLGTAQLDNGDLAVTIDHRDLLAEIVLARLGNPNIGTVFPNYTPTIRGITN